VERYAETVDASMSKAIAALVRLGLESQANRKREFFKRLKENLARDDPKEQDRMVDEFRALILGRWGMPKIQWERLPREKWAHLRDRARERGVSQDDLFELAEWKAQDPDVPDGDWYRDFGTFKLCGTGRFPSTFLMAGQSARGKRLWPDREGPACPTLGSV
jgi:hypothetical protein